MSQGRKIILGAAAGVLVGVLAFIAVPLMFLGDDEPIATVEPATETTETPNDETSSAAPAETATAEDVAGGVPIASPIAAAKAWVDAYEAKIFAGPTLAYANGVTPWETMTLVAEDGQWKVCDSYYPDTEEAVAEQEKVKDGEYDHLN